MVSPLILTPLTQIPLVRQGDSLPLLLLQAVAAEGIHWQDGDILVLAQKIVSKAEGRLVHLSTVLPSENAVQLAQKTGKDPRLVELILSESREVLRLRESLIIVEHRLGFVCANAGVDHSNVSGDWGAAEDLVLLLPEDPDLSAANIRDGLQTTTNCQLGVLIIDSFGRAWRNGVMGTTIGLAGVPGLVDLRGAPDLFGYQLRVTQIGAADELAAAASLIMGQADEGIPAVHVRGFPYPLRKSSIQELLRPKEFDLFR